VKSLVFIAAVVLLPLATEGERGTGLEVADARSVPVLIGDLGPEAKERGLSQGIIEARVNATLRKSGVKPVDSSVPGFDYFYDVEVEVVGVSAGITVSFERLVAYNDGSTDRHTVARTWTKWIMGTERSSDVILAKVSELTELFANEFLKANRK
jgi:hypothetical protein